MALSHSNLNNYFQQVFSLVQYHKWSLRDVENMMPWEREVHTALLIQHLEKEEERNNKQQQRYQ